MSLLTIFWTNTVKFKIRAIFFCFLFCISFESVLVAQNSNSMSKLDVASASIPQPLNLTILVPLASSIVGGLLVLGGQAIDRVRKK